MPNWRAKKMPHGWGRRGWVGVGVGRKCGVVGSQSPGSIKLSRSSACTQVITTWTATSQTWKWSCSHISAPATWHLNVCWRRAHNTIGNITEGSVLASGVCAIRESGRPAVHVGVRAGNQGSRAATGVIEKKKQKAWCSWHRPSKGKAKRKVELIIAYSHRAITAQ